MQHSYGAEYKHVRIRPLEERDIELLRMWRNDPEISRFLRPIPYITPEMQKKWFEGYLKDPSTVTFAVEEVERLHRVVGSLSIYGLSSQRKEGEIGKIVIADEEAHGRQVGYLALVLALQLGFTALGLESFNLSAHQQNGAALKIYDKAGFRREGSHPFTTGGLEVEMRLTREDFRKANPFVPCIKMER